MKLTDASISRIKATDRRQEIPDALCVGLYLIVQPTGKKGWQVRYRADGVHRRMTLGAYPLLSLSDARSRGREILLSAFDGNDPAAEARVAHKAKQEDKDRDKVSNLVEQFDKRHLANIKSRVNAKQFLDRFVVAEWGDRDIHDICKRDVIDLLDDICDSGRVTTANRVLAHARKFFNWCVERDIISVAPTVGVKPPAKETSRDRVLSDDEIRWFWTACEKVGQPWGAMGQTLLLTAQRLGEVAKMTDAEIDGGNWHLRPDRTKNKRPHDVPLSEAVQTVLGRMERVQSSAGYVFTTTGRTPVSGFNKARNIIAEHMALVAEDEVGEAVDIPHWTFHDLRRTAETGMARLRTPQEIIDRVTNHITGQHRMARVYNRHDYADEKRTALEAWSRLVSSLTEGKSDNVVQLEVSQ